MHNLVGANGLRYVDLACVLTPICTQCADRLRVHSRRIARACIHGARAFGYTSKMRALEFRSTPISRAYHWIARAVFGSRVRMVECARIRFCAPVAAEKQVTSIVARAPPARRSDTHLAVHPKCNPIRVELFALSFAQIELGFVKQSFPFLSLGDQKPSPYFSVHGA